MMKLIDKLLRMRIRLITFVVVVSSCTMKSNVVDNNNLIIDETETSKKIIEEEFLVARELCYRENQIDFCNDGSTDQLYRLEPGLIKYDSLLSIYDNYKKNGFFVINVKNQNTNSKLIFNDFLDSLFDDSTKYLTLKTSYEFNRKLKRLNKKAKVKGFKFDGYYKYALYKVKIKYQFREYKDILLPNVSMNNRKEPLVIYEKVKIMDIIDILSVESIDY